MGLLSFNARPVIFHCLVISIFASIVAPFGGFFASGVKRAFNIKDFGDLIPGHGGVTDRFDCQIMMSLFLYIYGQQMIFRSSNSYERAIDYLAMMETDDKVKLLEHMHANLVNNFLI